MNKKIDCIKFVPYNKGSLLGFADLFVHAFGMEIYGCQVFCKDGRKWLSFPSKETGVDDSGKKKYWPHVRFRRRESMDSFTSEAIPAIDAEIQKMEEERKKQDTFGQTNGSLSLDLWRETGEVAF